MKKTMALGAIIPMTLLLIFTEAVDLMDFMAVGTTLGGAMVDSTDLIGDGEIPIGAGAMEAGATDGDMADSTTLGTALITEDFMPLITDLTTEVGMVMQPIITEAEEIQVMPLVVLVTIAIDPVFPTEVVILGQKLAVDQAEPPIETAM